MGWIAADEAYGDNPELRHALQVRGLNYVMAVSCDTQIPTPAGKLRADRFVEQIPRNGWQILSAGRGSKGERLYAWAFTSISDSEPTQHRWLLLRRNLHTGELAYFLCHATTAVPLATLVRVAGTRWRVEENFQAGKGCAGLDEHQVRTWTSWHRWTTLAMLAHAFLAVTAARTRQPTTTHTASTTPSDTEHQNSDDSPYLQRDPAPPRSTHPSHPRPAAHRPMEPIPPTPPTPSQTLPLPSATGTQSRSTAVVLGTESRGRTSSAAPGRTLSGAERVTAGVAG